MNKYFNEHTTILVTGASSGIGKEITKLLILSYGSKVVGVGRNKEKLQALKSEFGDKFIPYLADVSVKQSFQDIKSFLDTNGIAISGIINSAGVLPKFSKFRSNVFDDAEKVLSTNFLSIVNSAGTFMPSLEKEKHPIIINVLSSSALCPFSGVSMYSASKSAGVRFSECLSFENKKIKVVTVMPGFTKTNVMRSQNASEKELSIIGKISAPADKVAKKIIRRASKGKTRVIIGFDAHLMNFLYKFFPRTAPRLIGWFLRKTKMKLFEEI